MEHVDTLLTGGTVVTMDAEWHIFANGAVAIRDGVIVAVGPASDLNERYTATETMIVVIVRLFLA
jgi:hypothetical protein